ncbi:hypothetical protein ACTXT7_006823 [Hymenolepis weldensis]
MNFQQRAPGHRPTYYILKDEFLHVSEISILRHYQSLKFNYLVLMAMCEIFNLVTPGSLRINIVCPQMAYSYRSEKLIKCPSDDSCRGTAHPAMFRNQSCSYYPFLFLQPPRTKASTNTLENYVSSLVCILRLSKTVVNKPECRNCLLTISCYPSEK